MGGVLEVTADQIGSLDAGQLVALLRKLLLADARRAGIARRGVLVPAQINVADDGEDGSIEWSDGPESTDYLPTRRCMFQVKASNKMEPEACRKEVKTKAGSLKVAVDECLAAGGTYIFFCSQPCNEKMIKARIEKIRQGIAEVTGDTYPDGDIHFYDANRTADWVNSHAPVAVWVIEQTTGVRLDHFRTWDKWALEEDLAEVEFVSAPSLDDQIEQIRSHLGEHRAVARVVGLSGLGKTRLAFEVFRPSSALGNPNQDSLAATLLYASGDVAAGDLVPQVQRICDEGSEVVLVVDDCPSDLHTQIRKIVRRVDSRMSLLTLDYDPEATANEENLIALDRCPDEVVKGILSQSCSQLSEADVSRVVGLAQGFPQVAVLLGRARLQDAPDLGALSDSDLLERMLVGRKGASEQARDVVRACAMFDVLGIEGDFSDQMAFAAKHLCGIEGREFYGILQDFIERGVIQKRGDFIQVQPKPLAIRLASEKWRRMPPEDALAIFREHMPPGLTEALCDQLAKLDFLPQAREAAGRLCEPTGPFGRLEVLNTESGSRCFRSIVEANPAAAMTALTRELGGRATDELREIGPGRRDLVGALEKLAFRGETFEEAVRLLLDLAVAENESWANNATGEFVSKFQMHLSGTEAPPELRFGVLDEALASGEPERERLAVEGLDRALETGHYSRSGGAETQGSGPSLKDWEPSTYGEVYDYLRGGLGRLTQIACSDSQWSEKAKKSIASHARGLVRTGIVDDVARSIETIVGHAGSYWPEGLDGVMSALQYDGKEMPPECLERIERLRDLLMPTTIEDRLRFFISELPWGLYTSEGGQTEERNRIARELATEIAEHPGVLYARLPDLLRGEQRQGYPFGHRLGQVLDAPERFIDEVVLTLRGLPREEANPTLLGAFLAGLEESRRDLVDLTLHRIASDDADVPDLAQLTSFITIQPRDIDRLCNCVLAGRQAVRPVLVLAYGSVLRSVGAEHVERLLDALITVGGEALWIALEIGMMYAHGDSDRFNAIDGTLRRIVLEGSLLEVPTVGQMSDHHLEQVIQRFLSRDGGDEDVAIHYARELVKRERRDTSGEWSHFWETLLPVLVKTHREAVWHIFGEALRGENAHAVESVLGGRFSTRDRGGAVAELGFDFTMDWCRANPDVGPQFVVRSLPLLEGESPKRWTPIVSAILNEFGDRDDVLLGLTLAMGTFSAWGSLVPYYEQYVEPLNVLAGSHPEANVRDWARDQLRRIEASIQREQKRDAERELGRY